MANQFCSSCGSSMNENATFCTNCGATKPNSAQAAQVQYAAPAPTPYIPPVQQTYYQPVQPAYQNNGQDTQPLTVGQYIGMFILMAIPVVGFILMLVWAFGSNVNINKKNYCRAALILGLIGLVLGIIISIFSATLLSSIFSNIDFSGYGSYY